MSHLVLFVLLLVVLGRAYCRWYLVDVKQTLGNTITKVISTTKEVSKQMGGQSGMLRSDSQQSLAIMESVATTHLGPYKKDPTSVGGYLTGSSLPQVGKHRRRLEDNYRDWLEEQPNPTIPLSVEITPHLIPEALETIRKITKKARIVFIEAHMLAQPTFPISLTSNQRALIYMLAGTPDTLKLSITGSHSVLIQPRQEFYLGPKTKGTLQQLDMSLVLYLVYQ